MKNTAQDSDRAIQFFVCGLRLMKQRFISKARMPHHISCKQRGAAAIEFAFVFPIFFIIFYGIVTYGLIFVAQQSITLAAAEGARAALRYAASDTVRNTNASNAAIGAGSTASWLGTRINFSGTVLPSCPYGAAGIRCYRSTVTYPSYQQNPLTPLLLGPLMGVVMPTQLSSTAIIQLD